MQLNKLTVEEAAEKYGKQFDYAEDSSPQLDFIEGAKWQAERMYSEEEVFQFFEKYREDFPIHRNIQVLPSLFEQWFEQFKKK
jgi:hypothetical protein